MGTKETFDELRLDLRASGAGYRLHAVASAASDAGVTADVTLPLTPAQIDEVVPQLDVPRGASDAGSPPVSVAKELGSALFATALGESRVYNLYRSALERAKAGGRGLRLVLRFDEAPELAALPWELLYEAPYFLALDGRTPVVRSVERGQPPEPAAFALPLRVLGVVADVPDLPALDVERERSIVQEALGAAGDRGQVELIWIDDATFAGVEGALRAAANADRPFHALHFIGHGIFDDEVGEGVLCFPDRNVTGLDLVQLLGRHELRIVVLNACEGARFDPRDPLSGVASTLVHGGIPAVVAMQFPVSDSAAIVFARGLYEGLAAAKPLDVAVTDARSAMFSSGAHRAEWATPVLFLLPGAASAIVLRRRSEVLLEVLRRRWRPIAGAVAATVALLVGLVAGAGGGGCSTESVLDRVSVTSTELITTVGVEVCDGDVLHITASGAVEHAPGQTTGPEGIPETSGDNAFPTNIWDGSNHGALIARIGDGEWFDVGAALDASVTSSGELELAVNDEGVDNNAGEFAVTVKVDRRD